MEQTQLKSLMLDREVSLLVTQCISLIPSQRKAAREKLFASSPEHLEPLLRLFETQRNNYYKNRGSLEFTCEILLWSIIFTIAILFGLSLAHLPIVPLVCLTVFTQIFMGKTSRSILKKFKYPYTIASALSKYNDSRIIGPLAEALMVDRYRLNRSITDRNYGYVESVTEQLEKIKSEQDLDLTVNQIESLNLALGGGSASLITAILHALPFIGNQKSIKAVKQLQNRFIQTSKLEILSAANACLPALEARVAKLNVSGTLLRSSSFSSDDADSLLRPNITSLHNHPDELLRASNGDE